MPSPGQVDTVLTGVDVRTASDVWAVGYCNDGGADRPLALHWNGSTWTSSPVPGAGLLREVKAVAPGNVWAAGAYYNVSLQRYQTLVVHFNGTKWTTVVSADSHAASDEVIGLAANPKGSALTLVGRAGPNALIEQANCPKRAGLAACPGTGAVAAAASRSGRRPRAEPAAADAPADRPLSR